MWCVVILIVVCSGLGCVLLCLLSLSVMVLCCRLRRFKMAALEKDGVSTSDPPSIFDHTGFMTHKGRINWVLTSYVFKYSSPSVTLKHMLVVCECRLCMSGFKGTARLNFQMDKLLNNESSGHVTSQHICLVIWWNKELLVFWDTDHTDGPLLSCKLLRALPANFGTLSRK
jgi:hypothetical protein